MNKKYGAVTTLICGIIIVFYNFFTVANSNMKELSEDPVVMIHRGFGEVKDRNDSAGIRGLAEIFLQLPKVSRQEINEKIILEAQFKEKYGMSVEKARNLSADLASVWYSIAPWLIAKGVLIGVVAAVWLQDKYKNKIMPSPARRSVDERAAIEAARFVVGRRR